MNEPAVLYALSTIAQTCAALAAFVGAMGIFRLQRLHDERAKLETAIREVRFELGGHDTSLRTHSMTRVVEWFHARDKRDQTVEAILPSVEAWCAIPSRLGRSRCWLIIFETWNVAVIGATLVGFNHVTALTCGPLTTPLLWVITLGTAAITLVCVTVWTES